ncbi:MAG: mechanosensitive ion channel domain-containing protein [Methylococcaceae bacterium]
MKIIDRTVIFFPFYHYLLLLLILAAIGSAAGAWAKPPASQTAQHSQTFEITHDALQAKIESINTRQGLDEALKSKLLSVYQSAQDNLENSNEFKVRATDYKQAIKQAAEKTKRQQKEITQTQARLAKQEPEDFTKIPTEELDQRLIIEKGKISSLDEQVKKLETELVLQNNRPQLIREEILTAQQDLESTQKQLQKPPAGTDSKLEVEATQVYQKTLIDSRTAELKMLEVEALSNPVRVELLKTELQLLNIHKDALSSVIAAIESLLTERREQEAKHVQDALSQAEKELSGKHVIIQTITRKNIQYSRDLQAITAKIDEYNEQKAKVDAQSGEIENDFKSAEKKISLAGLSPALGKILREQRRNLLAQNQFTLQSEIIQSETAATSLEQFKVEDNLKQLSDIDAGLQEIMALQVDQKLPAEQRMMIQAELRVLMNSQKELLNKLAVAYTSYLRTLGDFDFARQQMLAHAGKFAAFLDERLLWVPSSEPVNMNFIKGLYHSTKWLFSPVNWMTAMKDTHRTAVKWPFLTIIGLLSLVALLLCKKPSKLQLAAISDKVGKIYTDHFYYTLKALAYNLLLILPIPLFIYYLGWFLSSNLLVNDFSKAIGAGLQAAAMPLFFLQFFYRLFAPSGIACIHFQWQRSASSLLRRQLAWLRFIAVPTVFLINATNASKTSIYSDSLGRLALIISMVAMAVFFGRVLNPVHGLVKDYIAENAHGWLAKLRYVWYPASILVPLIIVGFAIAGYYLSALELQQKLIITLRIIFLTIVIHEMVYRWLTLVNRQLALENARQIRKAAALSEKHQPTPGGEDPVLPVEEQLIDIPKINSQTIKLLNLFIGFGLIIGFWMIWKNILPAFSFLDNIVLWQYKITIDKQESFQPITLTNLMLAGLYVFIAVVSVRNFSGVMELLLFRRLSIEAGGRYAVNQLAKYILVSIGFICVANELGGSWSQVQWLVAALSVGLGFGLQEIFANLVSGIILLFERPIRIGDTITIGDVTGKVSRIQMRATTLIDWDQKEHVVPNKTFITSQLVNWTLTDAITRLVIQIGIAYDSDVELAHKVMVDTVKSTPQILEEPAPSVMCVGFGDSSLKFTIYFYVSEMAHRVPVTHDLHMRLVNALRDHNIQIPFPQRDIHVRSVSQEFGAVKNHDIQKMVGLGAELSG